MGCCCHWTAPQGSRPYCLLMSPRRPSLPGGHAADVVLAAVLFGIGQSQVLLVWQTGAWAQSRTVKRWLEPCWWRRSPSH